MYFHAQTLLAGLANTMILFVVARLVAVGYREHSYLYQFQDRAKTLDAWIKFMLPVARHFKLRRYRADVTLKLSRSATRRGWNADHFIASQILLGIVTGGVSFVLLSLVLGVPFFLPLAAGAIATLFPYLKLSDLASSRYNAVNRDLPFIIDYLSLAMGAGLDFNRAMATVVKDAPSSPLVDELDLVLRNMRLGMSRAEALEEMDRRLDSQSLRLFVQTLIQGMELGTDVVTTLAAMSETLQQRRFQRAEEAAGKISVRMMIPMMGFVMPAVMIVLLGPMILAYLKTE